MHIQENKKQKKSKIRKRKKINFFKINSFSSFFLIQKKEMAEFPYSNEFYNSSENQHNPYENQ